MFNWLKKNKEIKVLDDRINLILDKLILNVQYLNINFIINYNIRINLLYDIKINIKPTWESFYVENNSLEFNIEKNKILTKSYCSDDYIKIKELYNLCIQQYKFKKYNEQSDLIDEVLKFNCVYTGINEEEQDGKTKS